MAVERWRGVRRRVASSTETVITCTGELSDPNFPRRFRSVLRELVTMVCRGTDERLRVRKMEPWNSVRVTFSIGVEAAERLRALAEAGGEVLARLGILSVQLPNGQVISLRTSTPPTPPNVVAPATSSLPPAASSAPPQPSAPSTPARFPFSSMAQASAIVSREAKVCNTAQPSHYPPPPYPDGRPEVPQTSPLLVNLLQTDQVVGGQTAALGNSGRPSAFTQPSASSSSAFQPKVTNQYLQTPPQRLPVAGHLQPTSPRQPVAPYHSQEPSPSSSSQTSDATVPLSSSGTTPTAEGKTVQYLINPLTGVLEPAVSSESESETETPAVTEKPPSPEPRLIAERLLPDRLLPPADMPRVENQLPNRLPVPEVPRERLLPPEMPNRLLQQAESRLLPAVVQEPPRVERLHPAPVVQEAVRIESRLLPTVQEPPRVESRLAPTPSSSMLPVVSLQRHPISAFTSNQHQLPISAAPIPKAEPEEECRTVAPVIVKKPDSAPTVALPAEPVLAMPLVEEERPKPEEKIKLRLKIEKTESSFNQYKTATPETTNGSLIVGGMPLATSPAAEPRVPPLHISLRGRPAVVSRKEKKRKEENTMTSSLDSSTREREPLIQGTYEGTCQFPSEAEVASILRSMPTGGKLLNTTVTTARRKRDKKKIYPRSVPRVEEKLKKGGGSLLKSVVKSAAKEVRMMTASRPSKPLQNKKPASPVLNNTTPVVNNAKTPPEVDFKPDISSVGKFKDSSAAGGTNGNASNGSTGDDSGIESMDALSEKSPNQSTSPLRKEEPGVKKKEKEVEEVVPIRLTPALYTYSNPERQREETPSPDHTEEDRFGGKSLLEQLLIDIPNGDTERRTNSHRRSPEISPTLPAAKRGRRPSESSSSDPPTPRPNKRKCSENASEIIKACMDDGKREAPLAQVEPADSSDDESKRKEEDDARLRLTEEKPSIRTSTFNTRRSARQNEPAREPRSTRKSSQIKKEEAVIPPAINATNKRRRNSKEK